jgi:hypothetical protein
MPSTNQAPAPAQSCLICGPNAALQGDVDAALTHADDLLNEIRDAIGRPLAHHLDMAIGEVFVQTIVRTRLRLRRLRPDLADLWELALADPEDLPRTAP